MGKIHGTNFVMNRPSAMEKRISHVASLLSILGIEGDIYDFSNSKKPEDLEDPKHRFIKVYYRDGSGYVNFLNQYGCLALSGIVSIDCIISRLKKMEPIFENFKNDVAITKDVDEIINGNKYLEGGED